MSSEKGRPSVNTHIDPAVAEKVAVTHDYFRRLRRRVQAGILAALLLPLALLSVYFHVQFNINMKSYSKQHLISLAESERNIINLFLQERVVNVFNLFHSSDFSLHPSQADMWNFLRNLQETSDAFIDVGFLTPDGIQAAYAGPFPALKQRDYSHEAWFKALRHQKSNYYISDIYPGLRNKLHFTIAVKQLFGGRPYIMRATLDPDKFYLFVRSTGKKVGVDSVLVNRKGQYQVVDPSQGEPLQKSGFMPGRGAGTGAAEVSRGERAGLYAYAWLTEVPWALVVRQPFHEAYAQMYRMRIILLFASIALVFILTAVTVITTNRLLTRAESSEVSKRELKSQLIHAAKLVSVGELAAGVAHEINNPLAIIASQSGVIRDYLDPQFGLAYTPETLVRELDDIDTAVFRARDITKKLLDLARKNEKPKLREIDVNKLLEDIVSGLIEKEMAVSNVELVRDYAKNPPRIVTEPNQLSQVILNLINNAVDALEGPGRITLSTSFADGALRIAVADTGKGMTSEQLEKIFTPFYTTKEAGKGTGLGLSVSLTIVEALGGRIDVQSLPGAGSSFTLVFPMENPARKV